MSHVPEREIEQCMRDTGMARVQAFFVCRQRHHLQELARRDLQAAAERAAQRYAERVATEGATA